MNRRERRATARDAAHGHGLNCGCSHFVTWACDGICTECGRPESVVFPAMPSSQKIGEVSMVGWSCSSCGGDVIGSGAVIEVHSA